MALLVCGVCWGNGHPAEVYRDHWCCPNFPSAWLGEFPLTAPGYLKVKISTWEHMTGSLGGVALHLISGWEWGVGMLPDQSPETDFSLPKEPGWEVRPTFQSAIISLRVSFSHLLGCFCEGQRDQSPR